jgi:hypothetical protein
MKQKREDPKVRKPELIYSVAILRRLKCAHLGGSVRVV